MPLEVVRLQPDRPATLPFEGGIIWIAVHDDYHLRERRRLRKLIRDMHPDRRHFTRKWFPHNTRTVHLCKKKLCAPHSTTPYLLAVVQLKTFIKREIKWYAKLNLTPPKG